MIFTGRSRELGWLRSILDRRTPQVVRVVGLTGVGKSALIHRAMTDFPGARVQCPPLPEPAQRAALAKALAPLSGDEVPDASDWPTLLTQALRLAQASERPWVLVLEDAHRLTEARVRLATPLAQALRAATESGTALHVVMVGRSAATPGEHPIGEFTPETLEVAPLPFRAAAVHLPGQDAEARLRAYGVFGGIPRVLAALDTSVTVGTNVRRLLLTAEGTLADGPLAWLEREVQTPSRYVSILSTLARGEADWGAVHGGVSDLTRSGQVAPYLRRLGELGLVCSRTPLDAGPRARITRYSLTDPFLAFWFRFGLPWMLTPRRLDPSLSIREHYARDIRPHIDEHMEAVMPLAARQHMELDALETMGSVARESGSLWAGGVEIPVVGMLRSGAAYYGMTAWRTPDRGASPLEALDRLIRDTRYGFGRERRLRVVFAGRAPPTWLRRESARRQDARLIDAEELLGS